MTRLSSRWDKFTTTVDHSVHCRLSPVTLEMHSINVFPHRMYVYAQTGTLLTQVGSTAGQSPGKKPIVVPDSMYGFGRPLRRPHLYALALLQGFTCDVVFGSNSTVETTRVVQDVSVKRDAFSPTWLEQYTEAAPECTLGRGRYTWQKTGLGSNINSE